MNEKFRLIIALIVLGIVLFVGTTLIWDLVIFVLGDKLNNFWLYIITTLLVYLLINLILKTNSGRYIEHNVKKLFKKSK